MSIIISKQGQDAQKLDKSDFEAEDYLQNYIHKNPEAIPVYEIEKNKKLFVVKREFETNSGPIDALAVDKDGDIYIVETKLYKNPDKRTVVAQALDYGSALWRHLNDFSEFIEILDRECQKNFESTFQEKLTDFFNLDEEQVEMQLDSMKKNLNEGNLKFVILMDSIDERLKDLIIYINQNSQFDIYAVQLEYYKFEQYEIMIPKLFGVEVKKNIRAASGKRRKWNENNFFSDAKNKLREIELRSVKNLYIFSKNNADNITWGTGIACGSFNPKFSKISTRSLYSVFSDGTLMINFGWLDDNEITKKYRDDFKKELEKLKNIIIPDDYSKKWFNISIEKWSSEVDNIIKLIKKLIKN